MPLSTAAVPDWAPLPDTDGVLHLICEGGPRTEDTARQMARVRQANVLDLVERFRGMAPGGAVAVYTSYPELARAASALGAVAVRTPAGGFHFGQTVQDAVRRFRPRALLAMGGGACPLFTPEDFAFTYRTLRESGPVVVANAPGSADLVACNHPPGLLWSELPPIDNSLPRALRALGYRRVLIPNAGRLHFDIDTPTDVAVLRQLRPSGARLCAALEEVAWQPPALEAALVRLHAPRPHVALIGRVPSDVLVFLDMTGRWRLHVLAEGRGMKSAGDADAGRGFVAALGAEAVLRACATACDVVFFDTRPLGMGWAADQADRFNSDLGRGERVQNADLRAVTEAAARAPVPVVLGGQCLVSGGIWLLAERLLANPPRVLPVPGRMP